MDSQAVDPDVEEVDQPLHDKLMKLVPKAAGPQRTLKPIDSEELKQFGVSRQDVAAQEARLYELAAPQPKKNTSGWKI